jgi:signal transduction histidine kinase
VESIPNNFVPAYRDTLITNEQTQREDVFRKKIMYLTIDGKHYRVEMSKGAEELYRFKDDIFNVILPMLGALVIVIVLANFILSGYLLEPFRRILKQMSLYKIGQPTPTDEISTSTKEFHQLKLLYDKMQRRIENDYYQLKEYTENMSHELQTPLAIIQNKTESLLSESRLQEDQAKKLKVIHDEIQQLSRLGSALNLITKIENNEFRNIQTVHTAPVIRKHIDKIEEIAVMKKLKIELLLDETHSFTIDPGLYDILIRNLIKNALQYSRDETTILFKTEQGKLIITNQGSKLEFPKNEIFTRFKKGNGSQSVGLGLAIVKKICAVSQLQIDYIQQVETHRFEIYHNHT